MYASQNWIIIGYRDDRQPVRQAITRSNMDLSSIIPLGITFRDIWFKLQKEIALESGDCTMLVIWFLNQDVDFDHD